MSTETKRCHSCGPQFDVARCNRKPEFCDAATPPTPMSETTKGEAPDILLLGLAEWLRVNHPVAAARYTPAIHAALRAIATPPTPDLDAVVARVRRSLDGLADDETFPDGTGYTFGYAADKRGTWVEMTVGDIRALLAAVSRPAEARGEPVAWGLTFLGILQTDAVYLTKGYAERELADRNARTPHDTDNRRLVPLYTLPAPSGGEGWSRELRQIADAVDLMIFAFNKGDSRREAVQEMANRIRAIAAAPRPEPGEPSEAMVEAAHARQCERVRGKREGEYGPYTNADWQDVMVLYRAALAAQREQTP